MLDSGFHAADVVTVPALRVDIVFARGDVLVAHQQGGPFQHVIGVGVRDQPVGGAVPQAVHGVCVGEEHRRAAGTAAGTGRPAVQPAGTEHAGTEVPRRDLPAAVDGARAHEVDLGAVSRRVVVHGTQVAQERLVRIEAGWARTPQLARVVERADAAEVARQPLTAGWTVAGQEGRVVRDAGAPVDVAVVREAGPAVGVGVVRDTGSPHLQGLGARSPQGQVGVTRQTRSVEGKVGVTRQAGSVEGKVGDVGDAGAGQSTQGAQLKEPRVVDDGGGLHHPFPF